jgi:hypothetical protein
MMAFNGGMAGIGSDVDQSCLDDLQHRTAFWKVLSSLLDAFVDCTQIFNASHQ